MPETLFQVRILTQALQILLTPKKMSPRPAIEKIIATPVSILRVCPLRAGKFYENETFGASFSSGFSTVNSSAAPKLKVPAMRLLGNTSRSVL